MSFYSFFLKYIAQYFCYEIIKHRVPVLKFDFLKIKFWVNLITWIFLKIKVELNIVNVKLHLKIYT